jgi:hypothetical protein
MSFNTLLYLCTNGKAKKSLSPLVIRVHNDLNHRRP